MQQQQKNYHELSQQELKEMQKVDFFKYAIDKNYINQVVIIDNELLPEKDNPKKKYVAYTISVSSQLQDYTIKKRYSEFANLHEKLKAKYRGSMKLEFPGKKLFGEQKPEFVKKRQSQLNQYIEELSNQYRQLRNQTFLDFLELFEKYEIKDQSQVRERVQSSYHPDLIQFEHNCKDEETFMQLLENLAKKKEERTQIFNQLRNFINNDKPKLRSYLVNIALIGDGRYPGLMQICGEHEGDENDQSTHLVCSYGLNLLNDIMQFEYNQRADLFLSIFQKAKEVQVKRLNFAKHIITTCNNNCKVASLKLLKKFLENKPQQDEPNLRLLVGGNIQVIKEYEKWLGLNFQSNKVYTYKPIQKHSDDMSLHKQPQQFQVVSNQIKTSNNLDFDNDEFEQKNQISQSDQKCKSKYNMSNQCFTDTYIGDIDSMDNSLQKTISENKSVTINQQQQQSPTQKHQIKANLKKTMINSQKTSYTNSKEMVSIFGNKQIQWQQIYQQDNIKVKKTTSTFTDDQLFKISIIVDYSALDASEVFLHKEQKWDNQLKEIQCIEKVDENSEFIKKTHFWQKSKGVNFITETNHVQTNKKNLSCIYQYSQPVDRDVQLLKDDYLGKCMTIVRIKDINTEESNPMHKESGFSTNSQSGIDVTNDSIKNQTQKCKIKIVKKCVNVDYKKYMSPLLLLEDFQYVDRYKNLNQQIGQHILDKQKEDEEKQISKKNKEKKQQDNIQQKLKENSQTTTSFNLQNEIQQIQ